MYYTIVHHASNKSPDVYDWFHYNKQSIDAGGYFILSHKTNFKDSAFILKALLCKLCTASLKKTVPSFEIWFSWWQLELHQWEKKQFKENMNVFSQPQHFIFPFKKTRALKMRCFLNFLYYEATVSLEVVVLFLRISIPS